MSQKLSDRIEALSESQTLAMSRKSRELVSQGIDVINLSIGEPDFDTPDFIKDAAKKAIDENFTHYTPVSGLASLREAVVIKFKRDNSLVFEKEQIVTSTGAKQSLANLSLSILNPGDEVLLPTPYWVSYHEIIKLAGGIPVPIHTSVDTDFKVTTSQIEEKISSKTRMFWFSSPCNPSGSVYSHDELKEIAGCFSKYPDIIIVADEIYEHINYSNKHTSIASFSEVRDQVVTVNGVSKGFAMTGWRLGYIGAPLWIAKACTKMQGQFTSAASSITQKAAEAALLADPSDVAYMKEAFRNRRDLVIDWLGEIPKIKISVPQGAFYIFFDISAYIGGQIKSTDELVNYLLNVGHVACVSGSAFGNENCIRISYAASEDVLRKAITRIKEVLQKIDS